ncbi:MAG TPA: HAMP domain-containing sensor histidine kinase [Miltoncostaeaceae bacterium]|nr:HAMP domain-containing sensor histidine kinase [Miltoncostaeaceae bacterium]
MEGAPIAARALEALPFQTAVLDGDGVIVATNRAWDAFAAENGGTAASCGVGASYVEVCRGVAADATDEARGLAADLAAVLAGRRDRVDLEYPCDSPSERRWFLMTAAALPGGPGAVVTHVDVTRRKLQELGIEQFSMSLAHDLQAPLRTAVGLAELVVSDVASGAPAEDLRRRVDALGDAAGRGRRLLQAMVARLRMERPAEPETFPLDEALRGAATAVAPRVRAAGGTLVLPETAPHVHADEARVRLVLVNLLENALKYRHPDRAPRIRVAAAPMGAGHVRVEVADNGAGIDPAHREAVFAPLRRFAPDPAATEGIGIGLALCRAAVESMGGRIWVEESDGEGTRVAFTLRVPGGFAPAPVPDGAAAG